VTRESSKSHGCDRVVCIHINISVFLCKRNESGGHSLKRESMHNSRVSKGTEKQKKIMGSRIFGQCFSNQVDK
jgi:hypothetical protein